MPPASAQDGGADEAPKIKILRNGPYQVRGDVPLRQARIQRDRDDVAERWVAGRDYPLDSPYHLCRCGRSRTKPFCDGAHAETGFEGRETPERDTYHDRAQRREGETVDLLDDPSLCVGATFCDREGSVWRLVDESGDPAKRDLAIQEACACPAGRLTVVDKDGAAVDPELPQAIELVEDTGRACRGPLWVKGGIPVEGPDGEVYETRNRVTLCRCGESRNQPYCDASHYGCENMAGTDP